MDAFLATPGSGARGGDTPSYRYKFENAVYDDASASLSVDGVRVNLEPRPLRLLAELLERVNEVVSKEELTENVWDGRPTVDNVFANAVTKLRKVLGEPAASRIVTVPRIGYRLEGPVERTTTGHAPFATMNLTAGEPVPFREGYLLERTLGSPSQDHVWLARHVKLRAERRVFKFAADAVSLRQLKREFTLYRVMQAVLGERPDIVRVFDYNFGEAPFFLECEYGGRDLLRWSEDEGAPLAAMTQEQRLALFLQAARAVAAAHSAGVLHKDLKPANVLISGEVDRWQVKLTDFGSGRTLDPDRLKALGLTAMGLTLTQNSDGDAISGTVMYLAPELFAGKAPSTQSDVYSLGILLYQLLIGDLRRPMSTGWEREVDDELLREDLAEATEGSIENRLESTAVLIERIARLEDRRRQRRQDDLYQQALQQAAVDQQHRRARLPWQIGVAVTLLIGFGATSLLYLRADTARAAATAEARRATAINEFMTQDLLRSVEISRSSDGRVLTAPEILERASASAARRFKEQPQVEASIHLALGDLQLKMEEPAALMEFEKAITLLQPVVLASNWQLLASKCGAARALAKRRRAEEGERLLHEVEDTLTSLTVSIPPDLSIAILRARIDVMAELLQHKAAIPLAQELVKEMDAWPDAQISDRFVARQLLAELLLRIDRPSPAKVILAELTKSPYSVDTVGVVTFARADLSVAQALLTDAKYEEADTLLQGTREEVLRALGPKSFLFGKVAQDLGSVANVRGETKRTIGYYEEAHAAYAASMGPEASATRTMAINLGMLEANLGDPERGLRILDELAPWVVSTRGGTDGIDLNRGQALLRLGRYQEAFERLSAINIDKFAQAQVAAPGQKWHVLGMRGAALFKLHRDAEGRALMLAAVEGMRRDNASPAMYRGYEKFLQSHATTVQ